MCSKVRMASRRTAFIATLAKMPSRHWVSTPHHDAHAAIGERHHHRRRQRPGDDVVGPDRRGAVAGERVGRPLEGERHRDGRELGDEDQHRGEHARAL